MGIVTSFLVYALLLIHWPALFACLQWCLRLRGSMANVDIGFRFDLTPHTFSDKNSVFLNRKLISGSQEAEIPFRFYTVGATNLFTLFINQTLFDFLFLCFPPLSPQWVPMVRPVKLMTFELQGRHYEHWILGALKWMLIWKVISEPCHRQILCHCDMANVIESWDRFLQ